MAAEKSAWTVMVYLAGDNNLTDASVYAMTEMKRVTPGGGVNIITQFDPRDEYLPTHRYHIGSKDQPGNIRPLSHDIIGTSENGGFKEESVFAEAHERVRNTARAKGRQEATKEAERQCVAEAKIIAAKLNGTGGPQTANLVNLEPSFIEPEQRTLRPNETDTGSPITLYNFMSLSVQRFPAERYMVVLAGHGSGMATDFLLRDDSPAGSLTINELKGAFQQLRSELNGQQIDVLGFDTCLMSMAEVAYELRGLVKVMVSSESYSPVSGWPYQQILSNMKEMVKESLTKPQLKDGIEERIAANIVDEYVNFYADYSLGGLAVDQSALDLRVADTLKELVDNFAAAMTDELLNEQPEFIDDIVMAHWEAQSYNGELFVDLVDFCDCLLKRRKTGPISVAGSNLRNFILDRFVLKSCYSGSAYQFSHGVSIYFPWSRIDDEYQNLEFIDDTGKTGWGRFLYVYTNLTRRAPRDTTPSNKFFIKNREVDPRPTQKDSRKGTRGAESDYQYA